jgi:hypothetical protein
MIKKGKKKEVQEEKTGEWVTVIGTPTSVLLPARRYRFSVSPEVYTMNIPRKGKFEDFDKKLFENQGEFEVLTYDEEKDTYTVNLSIISKILFAASKYPKLEDTQAFAPVGLFITKDNVEIVGNVIEMLKGDK